MQRDTRALLRTGIIVFGIGVLCVLSIYLFFGGLTRMGPHTNGGWLALIIALGCLPTGSLSLVLGLLKLFGDLRR